MKQGRTTRGGKALEMRMRESADGMEELALCAAYRPGAGGFEILAIEPAVPEHVPYTQSDLSRLRVVGAGRG